ncbi:MAG TPA: hypothetical protein VK892_04545 [Pyrinomonadaceae bacterium]|nr:hypothetical protein [Pyrinomonadaceae bacterium]
MLRNFLFVLFCALITINLACQSAETPNTANANAAKNQTNIPPEFSTSPVPYTGNSIPGIDPSNINMNAPQKGATPIPGIDPSKIGKTPMPKGTPPIPGIPDEETLKKQSNTVIRNANIAIKPPQ